MRLSGTRVYLSLYPRVKPVGLLLSRLGLEIHQATKRLDGFALLRIGKNEINHMAWSPLKQFAIIKSIHIGNLHFLSTNSSLFMRLTISLVSLRRSFRHYEPRAYQMLGNPRPALRRRDLYQNWISLGSPNKLPLAHAPG